MTVQNATTHLLAVLLGICIAAGTIGFYYGDSEPQTWKAQVQRFQKYLKTSGEVLGYINDGQGWELLIVDDINDDEQLDFVVLNKELNYCGSGGCAMGVYVEVGAGAYELVLDLFGQSTPHILNAKSQGYKDIAAINYSSGKLPIWSIYKWKDTKYVLSHYKFCGDLYFEYCDIDSGYDDVVAINLVNSEETSAKSTKPVQFYAGPDLQYEVLHTGPLGEVLGKVKNSDWYLVEIHWKGAAGFVEGKNIINQRKPAEPPS